MDFTSIGQLLISAVVSGITLGLVNGISTLISSSIANPTKPRRKKKSFSKKFILFLFFTIAIYAIIKFWPVIIGFI